MIAWSLHNKRIVHFFRWSFGVSCQSKQQRILCNILLESEFKRVIYHRQPIIWLTANKADLFKGSLKRKSKQSDDFTI